MSKEMMEEKTTISSNKSSDGTTLDYLASMEAALRSKYFDKFKSIEILSEKPLGAELPIQDLLVLKKDPKLKLTDDIGSFFKEHNVIENKGVNDSISVNDVFKAQAYAGMYMSINRKVDEIPWETMTVTAIQFQFPRATFTRLGKMGCKITELVSNAVWEVFGPPLSFPFRVVNAANLGDDWAVLKVIAPGASQETLLKLQQDFEQTDDQRVKEHLKGVLRVAYVNNRATFKKMKETGVMSDEIISAVKDLFENELKVMKLQDEAEKKRLTETNNQLKERNKQLIEEKKQLTDEKNQLADEKKQLIDEKDQLAEEMRVKDEGTVLYLLRNNSAIGDIKALVGWPIEKIFAFATEKGFKVEFH